MTAATGLLHDLFGRVAAELPRLLDGLDPASVHWQPGAGANPIGWLAWHIGRGEDAQMAHLAETDQVWTSRDWSGRFALPYADQDIGYGHSAEQVRAFHATDPGLLTGYYAEVHGRTAEILDGLSDEDFDRVVDRRWNPPVTLGVRIASILNDVTQHLGQVAYVRGLWERRASA